MSNDSGGLVNWLDSNEFRLKLYQFRIMETSPDSAYYKEVDKKHGNFLSVKVYLPE
jgi:hypothetical protein